MSNLNSSLRNPYILQSQAELAPTKIALIDAYHVGATFGCDSSLYWFPDLLDRDLEVAPTDISQMMVLRRAQRPALLGPRQQPDLVIPESAAGPPAAENPGKPV